MWDTWWSWRSLHAHLLWNTFCDLRLLGWLFPTRLGDRFQYRQKQCNVLTETKEPSFIGICWTLSGRGVKMPLTHVSWFSSKRMISCTVVNWWEGSASGSAYSNWILLLFAGSTRDLLFTIISSSDGSRTLGSWTCCGIQQVLLFAEKFLAPCALRCHSILLVVSTIRLLGGRIRSMGMILVCFS